MSESDKKAILQNIAMKALKMRLHIIEMTSKAGSGHPGGSLSAADILATLYFHHMRHDSKNPCWEERDRFVLCKGHAAPALYSALAEAGYFPLEDLGTLRKMGSHLQGHPNCKLTPGVEMSTGSLGQGLSIANGIALGAKLDAKNYRVYALLGDGELQEGQVWEAAMTASHYKLDNITAIIDRNGLQIDGSTEDVKGLSPLKEKWEAFGWHVIEIDGHDIEQIVTALKEATEIKNKPTAIIAKTIKGKGVSFMECVADWHGKAPDNEQAKKACREIFCLQASDNLEE